jgi:hypothetical protein
LSFETGCILISNEPTHGSNYAYDAQRTQKPYWHLALCQANSLLQVFWFDLEFLLSHIVTLRFYFCVSVMMNSRHDRSPLALTSLAWCSSSSITLSCLAIATLRASDYLCFSLLEDGRLRFTQKGGVRGSCES